MTNHTKDATKCNCCRRRDDLIRKVHLGYGIFLTAVVLTLGVCFAVSCLNIYNGGGSTPFTKESITAHFNKIAVPTYLSIAALIIGAIISLVMPCEDEALGKIHNPYIPLRSLGQRLKPSECEVELARGIEKERKFRFIVKISAAALCVILFGTALLFSLDFSRFTAEDVNGEVLGCVLISLPLSIGALISLFAMAMISSASATRELGITKLAVMKNKNALGEKAQEKSARNENLTLNAVRLAVLILGILFIILGISNGGMEQVLGKAVRICTECIGLG